MPEQGWWILMVLILITILGAILYTGVFLVWLHQAGGPRGLKEKIRKMMEAD